MAKVIAFIKKYKIVLAIVALILFAQIVQIRSCSSLRSEIMSERLIYANQVKLLNTEISQFTKVNATLAKENAALLKSIAAKDLLVISSKDTVDHLIAQAALTEEEKKKDFVPIAKYNLLASAVQEYKIVTVPALESKVILLEKSSATWEQRYNNQVGITNDYINKLQLCEDQRKKLESQVLGKAGGINFTTIAIVAVAFAVGKLL